MDEFKQIFAEMALRIVALENRVMDLENQASHPAGDVRPLELAR